MKSNNIIGYFVILISIIIILTIIFEYNYIILQPINNKNIINEPQNLPVIPTIITTPIPTTIPTPIHTKIPTTIPTPIPTTIPTPIPTTIPTVVETHKPINIENHSIINTFNYTLRGEHGTISTQLYSGINSYVASNGNPIACWKDEKDTTPCNHAENTSYYLKFIDDLSQIPTLNNLVKSIQSKTANKDDQTRIAISLVQHIPYDNYKASLVNITDVRFPYNVLYDNTGICEEKSLLLAYLLRELGYGVVLFEFGPERHMAVGIKSPYEYAYQDSEYAFVESTNPSIITNSQGNYTGVGKLTSIPQIYQISTGNSMISISEEYQDSLTYNQFGDNRLLAPEPYKEWETLVWKYGLIMNDGTTINENPSDKPLCEGNRLCNGKCWNACGTGKHWVCTSNGAECTY